MGAEGPDALDVVTASNYTVDHSSKLNTDYVRLYKQLIPNPIPDDAPSFIAVQAFDALTLIDRGIAGQKGAIDAAKTIDALRGVTVESPRGPISIDAQTREVRENMYIRRTQLVNGRFANIEIASYSPPK
jgi:branched-chain amino acid transport system substrate-binding protein